MFIDSYFIFIYTTFGNPNCCILLYFVNVPGYISIKLFFVRSEAFLSLSSALNILKHEIPSPSNEQLKQPKSPQVNFFFSHTIF